MARSKSITDIAILTLLLERPMYGAEMIDEIKRLSGNVVVMSLPTLYSALHKLATKKLVNSYWQKAEVGGRRHVYNITKLGREYYEKNKIDINYQQLKEKPIEPDKPFSSLEEAFSLPLNNQPQPQEIPEEKRVISLPEAQPAPSTPKTTPYIVPTDKITTSEVKQKQLSINLTGTIGSADLRVTLKLNQTKVGNDFVIINRMRAFACFLNTILFLFLNFLLSLTKASKIEYYNLVTVILLTYLAVVLAIFFVFPRIKILFIMSKSLKIRALVTLGLILLVILVTIIDQSLNLIWLGIYAFIPLTEWLLFAILRKGNAFTC